MKLLMHTIVILAVVALARSFPTMDKTQESEPAPEVKTGAQIQLVEEGSEDERMKYYLERQRALQRSANTGGRVFVKDVSKRMSPTFHGQQAQPQLEGQSKEVRFPEAKAPVENEGLQSIFAKAFALSGGTVHAPRTGGASYGGK